MSEVRPATAHAGKALPPELSRSVPVVSPALVAAAPNSAHRPEQPSLGGAVQRLADPRESPFVDTWEPDACGHLLHAVVKAVDPGIVQLNPLAYQ